MGLRPVADIIAIVVLSFYLVDAVPLTSNCESQLTSRLREASAGTADGLTTADVAEYVACKDRHRTPRANDDDEQLSSSVETLLQLLRGGSSDESRAMSRWRSTANEEPCSTVQCLGRRALSSLEACASLSPSQCSSLVAILENLTSHSRQRTSAAGENAQAAATVDGDAATGLEGELVAEQAQHELRSAILSRLGQLLAEYRKWRQDHVTGSNSSPAPRIRRSFGTENSVETGNEIEAKPLEKDHEARRKRSVLPPGIPFKLPEKMTPETQAILEAYLAWREKNGYGKITGRWG